MPRPLADFRALKSLISEAELILFAGDLEAIRSNRALELLRAASALTDDLMAQSSFAAPLRHRGTTKALKRGSDRFVQLVERKTPNAVMALKPKVAGW